MSELVTTLWFEDTGFLHEQMLDTPVGRFSIRQMGIFLVFGLLAWGFSLVFAGLVFKVVVAGGIFFAGVALFARKVKTVSPEVHLLYLSKRFLQTTIKQKISSSTNKSRSSVEQSSKGMLLFATLGVPVKVVGVLKDFSGKILQGKNFKVNVNDTAYSNGTTDHEGCFCTYFIPDRTGLFEVTIQPQDHPATIQKITIQVNPNQKTQKETEVKENAQKTISKFQI